MLLKWASSKGRDAFNEKGLALAWGKSWGNDEWTLMRTKLNPTGGLPCDQQGLEAKNGAQKADGHWKRKGLTQFLPDFVKWLNSESLEDLAFGTEMPKGRHGTDMWDINFFDQVHQELQRRKDGTGIFVCTFDDPEDLQVMWITSRRLITTLQAHPYRIKDEKAPLRSALTTAKNAATSLSWLAAHQLIAKSATLAEATQNQKLDKLHFDMLMDYATSFFALTNIVDALYTARLAERLLRAGAVLNLKKICKEDDMPPTGSLEISPTHIDVAKLKSTSGEQATGFVSCLCNTYTHYHFCIHVCGVAKLRGVIKKFPVNMDRLGDRSAGALPSIVRGGALGRQ